MSGGWFSFQNAPIRIKLTILSMGATILALALATLLTMINSIMFKWNTHEAELWMKTKVIGANSRAALLFGDEEHLTRNLSAVTTDSSIIQAAIYSADGEVRAHYIHPGESASTLRIRPAGTYFEWENLSLYSPIMMDGERVGTVYIEDDLKEFYYLVQMTLLMSMAAALVAAAAAYLFWSRAQRIITDPISSLAGAMQRVSHTRDFTLRMENPGKDEMGALMAGFNEMLGQIQEKEQKLEEHSHSLENQVLSRTQELREKNEMLRSELGERLKTEVALNRERELFIHGPAVAFKLAATQGWPVEYISPNVVQFGYQPLEVISRGRTLLDMIAQDDRGRFSYDASKCLAGDDTSFEGEYRLIGGEGQTFWLDITAVFVLDANRKVIHMDGYALDITERKKYEKKLNESMVELKRFNRLMSGREKRIMELKADINALMTLKGEEPRFNTTLEEETEPIPEQESAAVSRQASFRLVVVDRDAALKAGLETTMVEVAYCHSTCSAPMVLAGEKGFFARRGLNAKIEAAKAPPYIRELLTMGKVKAVIMPMPEILAMAAGAGSGAVDVKVLPLYRADNQGLALSIRHMGLEDFSGLRGMTFGVPGFDTINCHLLFHSLAENGIDPLNDVIIREIDPALTSYYLRKGKVDGVFASEPFLGAALDTNDAYIMVRSSQIWRGHPCCGLALQGEFYSGAPKSAGALLEGFVEGAVAMETLDITEISLLANALAEPGHTPWIDGGAIEKALIPRLGEGEPRFVSDPTGLGGVWQLAQMQRWGRLRENIDHQKLIEQVFITGHLASAEFPQADTPPMEMKSDLPKAIIGLSYSVFNPDSQPQHMDLEPGDHESLVTGANLVLTQALERNADITFKPLGKGQPGRLDRLASGIAATLRSLEDTLMEQRELLEKRVDERTGELSSSRKIALNMMEDAQEARQRAEKMADEIKEARHVAEIAAQDLKSTLLVSEQLRQETEKAKDLAERMALEAAQASTAKSDFMANMSHELRTPLNGVIGLTEVLLNGGVSNDQRKKLEMIKFSGSVLLNLVNDILDLARIEAGKMILISSKFSPRELVEKAVSQYALAAHDKGLELVMDIADDLPATVIGDPGRINQVVTNLIGNAVKFTAIGEVAVCVELEEATEGQVTLLFSVRDTGIGVSDEQKEKIFSRFTQGDTSITRKYGGAGLGVTISRQLVDKMGGRIWLESRPGVGSTFFFTLSFQAPDEDVAQPGPDPRLIGKRILIVDDNESSRNSLARIAKSIGMEVTVCADGPDALRVMMAADSEGRPFPMAVFDNDMPRMTGHNLARKIRMSTFGSATHVALMCVWGRSPEGVSERDGVAD
ncbi:MAG: ATP-binding protein, partial [Nitrospinota bacterium]|nr:ATP-binding protein [Nitrospinota bacterium]